MSSERREQELRQRLQRLNEIGVALSLEHDLTALLRRILHEARQFTRADAGTLYLVVGDELTFEIAQNDSLQDLSSEEGDLKGRIPPVPITRASASGYAASTGVVLNITDVYTDQKYQFEAPKAYDQMTGYHSQSMLVVPMKDHEGKVIGVLQLLNSLDPDSGKIVEFSSEDEELTVSLASQATVAISHVRLIEETKRLNRQNELILNTAGEGIFGLDTRGRITFANPAAGSMLGWDVDDLVLRAHDDLCHHSHDSDGQKSEEQCPIALCHRQGVQQRISDGVFWRQDNTSLPVEYIATPIREDEVLTGAVVVFRDVTDDRLAEEERRNLQGHLIQSERMASVGVVAAGIVHNLRNALTGILSYGELLQVQHPEIEGIAPIVSAAEHMDRMVDDILAKSRKQKSTENVNVNDLLLAELEFLRADQMFKHDVEKDIRLDERLPELKCVYTDISQAVGNLMRNAVAAMRGRTTKRLTVATSTEAGRIAIEITDTGCGIEKDHIPQLFEPFFSARSTDGGEGGEVGTGLGLYMVQQLLEPYKAEIEVKSAVEMGTTFWIRIPRTS